MTAKRQVSPRRWFSFSLRGAFVLLTIACVWLALQVTAARRQQDAVGRAEELGAPLKFEEQAHVPQWLRSAVGEEYFRKVVSVDFSFGGLGKATDDELAVFKVLTDVTSLELGRNPDITDAGLKHLSGLTKLNTLYLYRTNITGPGIQHLPRNLEYLSLASTPLGDEGLAHLKQLPKLKWLKLDRTAISDRGLADLSAVVSLEELQLHQTDITDAGLEHLASLKNLQTLSLHCTNVTGRGVAQLQQALPNCQIRPTPQWLDAVPADVALWPDGHKPSKAEILAKVQELGGTANLDASDPEQPIVRLSLSDSTISDESLLRLLAELPDLELLTLSNVLVGDRLAQGLTGLSNLWYLSLDGSRITDQGLKSIGQLTALRELHVDGTRITDAGLTHLAGMKSLEALHASNTRATDKGRAKLRQALPRCRIQD